MASRCSDCVRSSTVVLEKERGREIDDQIVSGPGRGVEPFRVHVQEGCSREFRQMAEPWRH